MLVASDTTGMFQGADFERVMLTTAHSRGSDRLLTWVSRSGPRRAKGTHMAGGEVTVLPDVAGGAGSGSSGR